jgi:DNA-binding PadR family transcriptional regulator
MTYQHAEDLRRLVLRTLVEREAYGYELLGELAAKGVELRPNYLYMILAEMERDGLLLGRWTRRPGGAGPRRHVYTLSEKGEKEYTNLVKDSLGLLMGAFFHHNQTREDITRHKERVRDLVDSLDTAPHNLKGARVVIAIPSYDPLVCFPLYYYAWAEAFPNASIHLVKPRHLKLPASRPNVSLLDGSRNDIPLKDGFADLVVLEGIPNNATARETVAECMRVLKNGGNLIVRVSNSMTEERRSNYMSLFYFIERSFYELQGEDGKVSVNGLKKMLARHFADVRDSEFQGNTTLAGVKMLGAQARRLVLVRQ